MLKQRLPDAAGVDRGAQCEKRRSTNLAGNGLAQSARKESVLTKFRAITVHKRVSFNLYGRSDHKQKCCLPNILLLIKKYRIDEKLFLFKVLDKIQKINFLFTFYVM